MNKKKTTTSANPELSYTGMGALMYGLPPIAKRVLADQGTDPEWESFWAAMQAQARVLYGRYATLLRIDEVYFKDAGGWGEATPDHKRTTRADGWNLIVRAIDGTIHTPDVYRK